MKKIKILQLIMVGILVFTPITNTYGQLAIAQIIQAGIKRVIKAVDLRIQRMQNQTIWLQNAQKEIENSLSKLRLQEIGEWSERQKELYSNYYQELTKVKSVIRYYYKITQMADLQKSILQEYRIAWNSFAVEPLFSVSEKAFIQQVHQGILQDCLENFDLLSLIVESFLTQMSDAERIILIEKAHQRIERNYLDMKAFNQQNTMLRLNRKKSEQEVQQLRKMY